MRPDHDHKCLDPHGCDICAERIFTDEWVIENFGRPLRVGVLVPVEKPHAGKRERRKKAA